MDTGQLILASSSKNRQQGLSLARIPFRIVPSDIDETSINHPDITEKLVMIAKAKVAKVAASNQGLILGFDGMNVCKGQQLGKPKDKTEAVAMIRLQSGNICSFFTGFYILNTQTKKEYQGITETRYKFRELSEVEINRHIETEPVMQWAAAFSPLNSSAITFVDWFQGSPSQFAFSMPFDRIIPILKIEGVYE
jgi:septum formation protein